MLVQMLQTVMEVLSVVTFFWLHPNQRALGTEPLLCVTCQELSLYPDEDIEGFSNFSVRRNGTSVLCCLNTLPAIAEMVSRLMERKRRKNVSKGVFNDLPIECDVDERNKENTKLVGKLPSVQNKSEEYMTNVRWDINSAASFLGSTFTFINGSISVLESDFYYIYSNLVYSQEWKNNTDDLRTFCHVLYQHTPLTEIKHDLILMKNCNSICKPYKASAHCMGSSYVGSVFFLRKGEEIYIKVSDPEMLHENGRDNIFGLFRT
ncbi:hypothetical protein CHS0354_038981 [Potamilus streckersoni]|uniref:THD domain-containing protein n=1 Tax=Potamilus streckersoni TaxID=2493646 RepID=A0AAE0VM61_9BIVA|nr:hypothetical protein CHS0354_038981 [Potamilus streckersoni]